MYHQDIICLFLNQRNELVHVYGFPGKKSSKIPIWVTEMFLLRNAGD
jgi:hypothetical protein